MGKDREFDLIIFGAAGCTGKYTVEELVKFQSKNVGPKFTWAVAAQNERELRLMLAEVTILTEKDCTTIKRFIADATDPYSLAAMVSRCRVLINCVGPFRFLGENVVRACIAEGTDLIDASGEVQYLLKIHHLYNGQAEEKKVFVVGSCGFASIPADLGTVYLQQNFPGDLNSVEIFFNMGDYSMKSRKGNYASYRSLIHIFANLKEWDELEKLVLGGSQYRHKYPLVDKGILHYSKDVSSWCMFNPQCDSSVVRRTQNYLLREGNQRPVQVKSYIKFPTLLFTIISIAVTFFFAGLSQFRISRYFMEKFPKIFSFGCCNPDKKIPRELLSALGFKFTIVGRGWDSKLEGRENEHHGPPNRELRVEVSGHNPFYAASGIMLIQSALMVLFEREKLPPRGGVYSPGAAFARTSIVNKLNANGVSFKVMS